MGSDPGSFSKTGLANISDNLSGLFSNLSKDGDNYIRAVNGNLIMPVSSRAALKIADELIDALALVHPCRFFQVTNDESKSNVEAEVAAMCHGLTKEEHSCSEIVRLFGPPDKAKSIPNILRAHLLSGMPTELFLCDPAVKPELVEALNTICDQVYIDSSDFEDRIDMLEKLYEQTQNLVDFQWVALGMWRDQIRAVFDKPALLEHLAGLHTIEIGAEVKGNLRSNGGHAICGLLMAGWIIQRMGLEPKAYKDYKFECATSNGRTIFLRLHTSGPAEATRVNKIQFLSKNSQGADCAMKFERNSLLETTIVTGKEEIHMSRPYEDETRTGCVKRFFTVGESFTNYGEALGCALELDRLWKAA